MRTTTFRVFPSITRVPSHCVLRPLRFRISLRAPSYFYPRNMPSSTKKQTAAKKQQPQQQQPPLSVPSPSAPAAPTTSDPKPTAIAKISAINFRTFIQHAKLEDIEKFLKLASTTQDGRNLAFFWEQAYDRRYTEGRADVLREELDMASERLQNEWMLRGQDVGYEQGYKKGKEDCLRDLNVATYTAAFEEGRRKGEENEKQLWEALGHMYDQRCMSQQPTRETISIGIQSELPYVPPMVSSPTQTSPPSLVNIDTQTSVAMDSPPPVLPVSRLDWAEDATSLPIAPLLSTPLAPCQCAPCDFSGLHSSRPNPFGSLQRRSKQSHTQTAYRLCQKIPFTQPLHSRYQPSPLRPPSSLPKPQILRQASKNEPLVSSPSVLDWDQDPRLSDLSWALKALGWIRP